MVHCAAMVATAFPKEGLLEELSHIQGRSPMFENDFRSQQNGQPKLFSI
jgi:hypothetical protein